MTSRLAAIAAAAGTALAALLSFGAIAFTGAAASALSAGARFGIVPLDWWHLAAAATAGAVVLAIGWNGRGDPRAILSAVAPLALVLLPWLPFGVPRAFLIWTGGVLTLVWMAVGLSLMHVAFGGRFTVTNRPFTDRFPAFVPGAVSFVIFATAAWGASPSLPGGDEPHYLVITQSLLYDRDLQIENNHQRGDYRAYYAGDLQPDSLRRGRNGALYSVHAPGVPALVLPAFAIGGYRGVVIFLILCSSAACALAWWLAWRATGNRSAAWFAWAAVTLAPPFLLESYTVFPDGPGAAIVLTGFWALLRAQWEGSDTAEKGARPVPGRCQTRVRPGSDQGQTSVRGASDPGLTPWLLHGFALSLLPWMHTRFSVLAATLGGVILVRLARVPNAMTKAIAFLLPPAISAVAWMFFFAVLYGTPDPSAPYGGRVDSSFAFLPNGLGGLLFDQGFGLLATAPVLVAAFAGFARTRRLFFEWLVVAAPYALTVTTYAMWWAGMSGPARFLVPLVLPLAIPAAYAWTTASRGCRSVRLAALLVTAWLAIVMAGAGGGRLGYHTRNEGGLTAAPWMEWATRVVDLPSAAPAFVPLPVGTPLAARMTAARSGFAATLPWILFLGAAAFGVAWWIDRGGGVAPERRVAGLTIATAAAVMLASSIVWGMQGTAMNAVPAQIDALRMLAASRVAAVSLTGRHRLRADEAWGMSLEIPIPARVGRGGPRPLNRPIAVFPALPAGSYLLQVRRHGGPLNNDGWVMAGVGTDQFAIVTQPIAAFDAGVRLDLPVDVRAINIRTDEGARDQLVAVTLRPIARAPAALSDDYAKRAVRYDATVAYFLDDRAFPEPAGFWVGGARDTFFALRGDQSRGAVTLVLRNGAAHNRVLLESGAWRGDVGFGPGEERRVEVPLDPATHSALIRIRSESGFRPTDVDGRSKDTRFLGVFVRIE